LSYTEGGMACGVERGWSERAASGLVAVSSLTPLKFLDLSYRDKLTNEGLQTLSCLTALYAINLFNCPNLTAAEKQALCTAIPNLTVHD
jgi:hypothetical protein